MLRAQRERALKALDASPGPAASGGSDDVDAPPAPGPNRTPEIWGGLTPLVFAARRATSSPRGSCSRPAPT